jgi:hypothetical protein
MCRHEVVVQDAIVAVYVTETSKSADSMLGYESVLHKDFDTDPTTEYYHHEQVILEHLSLVEFSTKPQSSPRHDDAQSRQRRRRRRQERDGNDDESGGEDNDDDVVRVGNQSTNMNSSNRWSQAVQAHRTQV